MPNRGIALSISNPDKWNNETFGQTIEQAISDISGISSGIDANRVDSEMAKQLEPHLSSAFAGLKITSAVGSKNTAVDFNGLLEGKNVSISVKSNTSGNKVCPQTIGQTTKQGFCSHFGITSQSDDDIKQWILDHPNNLLREYANNLNICDIIVHVQATKSKNAIYLKSISWYKREHFENIDWMLGECVFTKKTVSAWNESSSIRFRNIPIGEFQIHNNRNNIKFRFNFRNLLKLL